jgi:hypothetical protein
MFFLQFQTKFVKMLFGAKFSCFFVSFVHILFKVDWFDCLFWHKTAVFFKFNVDLSTVIGEHICYDVSQLISTFACKLWNILEKLALQGNCYLSCFVANLAGV